MSVLLSGCYVGSINRNGGSVQQPGSAGSERLARINKRAYSSDVLEGNASHREHRVSSYI